MITPTPTSIDKLDELSQQFENLSALYIEFCGDTAKDLKKLNQDQEFNMELFVRIARALAAEHEARNHLAKSYDKLLDALEEYKRVVNANYLQKPVLSGRERSIIKIGTITTYSTKRFCRLSKWLHRKLFGIVIEDFVYTEDAILSFAKHMEEISSSTTTEAVNEYDNDGDESSVLGKENNE